MSSNTLGSAPLRVCPYGTAGQGPVTVRRDVHGVAPHVQRGNPAGQACRSRMDTAEVESFYAEVAQPVERRVETAGAVVRLHPSAPFFNQPTQKGITMRKQLMRQPVRACRTVVQAIARRLARMTRTVVRRPTPDLRDLDQRVREIGEW
jgi:hypothetical protein